MGVVGWAPPPSPGSPHFNHWIGRLYTHHTTKTAKIGKKVILLCNTSPECQCNAVWQSFWGFHGNTANFDYYRDKYRSIRTFSEFFIIPCQSMPTVPYFPGRPVFWHVCPGSRLMSSRDAKCSVFSSTLGIVWRFSLYGDSSADTKEMMMCTVRNLQWCRFGDTTCMSMTLVKGIICCNSVLMYSIMVTFVQIATFRVQIIRKKFCSEDGDGCMFCFLMIHCSCSNVQVKYS